MMESQQSSRASLKSGLKALFASGNYEKSMPHSLDEGDLSPEKMDLIDNYDRRGFCQSENSRHITLIVGNKDSILINLSQSDMSLSENKDLVSYIDYRGRSGTKDSFTMSGNKDSFLLSLTKDSPLDERDTASVSETKETASVCGSLPDEVDANNEETPETERIGYEDDDEDEASDSEDAVNKRAILESITVDKDILTIKFKDCCPFECSGPLGMEGGIISNQQITASSTHRALFGLQKWYPYFARLNKKGLVNAWTAAENDRWPWIQINLQRRMRVTGLITQGAKRIGSPEYVKSYKVAASDDGKTWRTYKVKGTDEDMIFRGNVDNNTPSANSFTPPIEAQYVRIYPQVCRRHCTLRMELLGCEITGCSEPMGMKSGHIQDYQISASSIFRTLNMDMFTWEPGKARLDKQGKVNAWTSGHSDQSQWLQVDMLLPTKVTGIITQGAKDFGHVQFVGSYKVAYSSDGERWIVYQDEKQKKDKAFAATSNYGSFICENPIKGRGGMSRLEGLQELIVEQWGGRENWGSHKRLSQ
ncbi:hypothetical protein JZ751_001065, partial [Albula glossodonta]